MKFAVIGLGKTGHTMSCYLAHLGHEVMAWDRKQEKVDLINKSGITVTGAIEGHFSVQATTDLKQAVRGAQYIVVMTVAGGHKPVAEQLKGLLEEGQRILIFNGNWGAYEFYCVLKEELASKQVLVGETSGMLLLSNLTRVGECVLKSIKAKIDLATIPAAKVGTMIAELKDVFPQFEPAANVVETSLNNSNPVMHVPITLFNLTRLENAEDYSFYGTAATRLTLGYVVAVDEERVAVAKAVGIKPQTCLEIINSFWPDKYDTLYDAMKNNKGYIAGKGPTSVRFRYITEDIPYGIEPIVSLGKKYGVPTPKLEALLTVYNFVLEPGTKQTGPDFGVIDMAEVME